MNFISSVNTVTRPLTPASANERKVESLSPDSSAKHQSEQQAPVAGYVHNADDQDAYSREEPGSQSQTTASEHDGQQPVKALGLEQDAQGGKADPKKSGTEEQVHDRRKTAQGPGNEQELDEAALREVQKLSSRDREVRAHEAAHLSAAAGLAKGGPQFAFKRGPDGKQYAVSGEVSIDNSKINGDPQATIAKAQQVRAAALAPANPSTQDRRVAAGASQMEMEARAELARQAGAEPRRNGSADRVSTKVNAEKESVSAKQAGSAEPPVLRSDRAPSDLYTQLEGIQNRKGSVIDIVV